MKRRSLIYVLAAAVLVSLFAVTPGAMAAKKPALNKKSATLKVGEKLKLKVKNNKKKVKWSSSKKKVAAVSKKGVVTAKSAGKANITAKIGKKKLVCKVTVKAKDSSGGKDSGKPASTGIKIAAITFPSRYQIQVQLSGAQALTAANFTIKSKYYELGSYNRVCKIQSITSADKINYLIELANEEYMDLYSFVQVTITGLTGTGTEVKEAVFNNGKFTYENSSRIRLEKNVRFSESIYFEDLYGNCTINSVTGLPAGIKYNTSPSGYTLKFFGIPTQAGMFNTIVSATDEMGNVEKHTVYFMIGDATTLAALFKPIYIAVNADGTRELSYVYEKYVDVTGGSNSYLYEIVGDSHGLTIDSNGGISGSIKTPGTYEITIKVTDSNDSTVQTTCKAVINVIKGKMVKGVVKDAAGAPIVGDVRIVFENTDDGSKFTGDIVYADEKGEYAAMLVDGTYSAYASINGVKSPVKTVTVNSDMSNVDFVVPVYKVTFADEGASLTGFSYWDEVNTGKQYESYNNFIYLGEGTYNLEMYKEKGMAVYEAAFSNLVVSASSPKTVNVKVKTTSLLDTKVLGTIGVEQKNVVSDSVSSSFLYYKFVPTETKTYYFYSISSCDPVGELRDAQGTSLIGNDDEIGTDFLFDYECKKGETYYFGFNSYTASQHFTIGISESEPL